MGVWSRRSRSALAHQGHGLRQFPRRGHVLVPPPGRGQVHHLPPQAGLPETLGVEEGVHPLHAHAPDEDVAGAVVAHHHREEGEVPVGQLRPGLEVAQDSAVLHQVLVVQGVDVGELRPSFRLGLAVQLHQEGQLDGAGGRKEFVAAQGVALTGGEAAHVDAHPAVHLAGDAGDVLAQAGPEPGRARGGRLGPREGAGSREEGGEQQDAEPQPHGEPPSRGPF